MMVKHLPWRFPSESRLTQESKTLERKMAEKGGFEPPTPF